MSSLMDIVCEESAIVLTTGSAARGTKEVSQLLQCVKNACYVKGANVGFVYGALFSLSIMGGIVIAKKFRNRMKEA